MRVYPSLYGALVIAAMTPVVEPLPPLQGGRSGTHSGAKHRGRWFHKTNEHLVTETELAMPTRDKCLSITTFGSAASAINRALSDQLVELDSKYEGARQLNKLQKVMDELDGSHDADLHLPYLAVINNTASHGWIGLLSRRWPLHLYGVYDTVNTSVQLVWTTEESFVHECRVANMTRYVFYRFPMIENRPLFINTQVVCARWYDWMKSFKGFDAHLRAFNVLETALYLDPHKESFERS